MKIYIDTPVTQDLSNFADDQLEAWGIYSRENAAKPIHIKNFRLGLNADGYVAISFATENHKYLDVCYNTWSSARIDEDYVEKPWGSKAIRLSTHDEYQDGEYSVGDPMMLPISIMSIWLEPDSKEEDAALNGVACILPTKWSYEIVIVPFSKFDSDDSEPISEFEDEAVYTNELFETTDPTPPQNDSDKRETTSGN